MPTCRTPGAHYGITVSPRLVEVRVCLPEALTLRLDEAGAKDLEERLHNSVEGLLARYFDFPKPFVMAWKGKGPMPYLAVGDVQSRFNDQYYVLLTREDLAWLCDDWDFNSNWDISEITC